MLFGKLYIFFSLLHLFNCHLQINLHLTDWVSEDDNIQHDCLQVPAHNERESDPREIISYCMGEWISKSEIKKNNRDQTFTFEQLSQQNITSEQLYLWSAPIDLIEEYQLYLNELRNSKKTSRSTGIFYNCTLPFFGSQCQYILQDYKRDHSSLDDFIYDYYHYNRYRPTLLTCYIHLECNRGPSPSCLDWTEICDGKVDCIDNGYDEEHCWKMEIQEYQGDIYQNSNQDCISVAFFRQNIGPTKCVDQLDAVEMGDLISNKKSFQIQEPRFQLEDHSCPTFVFGRTGLLPSRSACGSRPRFDLLLQAKFSAKPNSMSHECWTAIKCFINESTLYGLNCLGMQNSTIIYKIIMKIINETCPDIIYIPATPILLNHIYVAYDKHKLSYNSTHFDPKPTYFCYNTSLLYLRDDGPEKISLQNSTCHFYNIVTYGGYPLIRFINGYIADLYFWLEKNTVTSNKNSAFIDNPNMYQCMNWPKKVSKHRLFDIFRDCPDDDDEIINTTCPTEQAANYFKCIEIDKCIPSYLTKNQVCDCGYDLNNHCSDRDLNSLNSRSNVLFQSICDGYPHLLPYLIEGDNETDETNCEHWPHIHVYNRCDGFWDDLNGLDEINCDPSPILNCPANNHICVSSSTYELICIPIERANDGIIDCVGAADEPKFCQENVKNVFPRTMFCQNITFGFCGLAEWICDGNQACRNNEDEKVCSIDDLSGDSKRVGVCKRNYELEGSDKAKLLCRRFRYYFEVNIFFTVNKWSNLIERHSKKEPDLSRENVQQPLQSYQQRCHLGLDLQVWLDKDKNLTRNVCLCPPSYYGDICQYQNQRVSLTLQFRATSHSQQTPFTIIVSLIDNTDERIIHSYEQFTYSSLKHCRRRFNIYLLYSTKPKDETKDYSIQIDIYEKRTLEYRASFIKSLNFSFLPVHRVALQINIPPIIQDVNDCSDIKCRYGTCRSYVNDKNNRTFCECKNGWIGKSCSIPYISNCAFDSLSIGRLANNRSLCVCPLNKIGPRCLIDDNTCQNNQNLTCLNKGECVFIDQYKTLKKRFVCICSNDFTGEQCEIAKTKLIMTFDKTISLPSSIHIHFIEAKLDALPVRTTTFKKTFDYENLVIVFWSLPFHIAFVELLNKTYYFIYMQTVYKQSLIIEKTINSSDQCLHINELFNQTILNYSPRRRIKYYHLPCQTNSSQLKCFYDDIHLCLCQQILQHRVANCFEFDHNMSLYCSDQSSCQNGGECFQEQISCPRVSICNCTTCYYGAQCQLSANGFSLSLDTILGLHIRPNLNISHQPSAVFISLIVTIIITLLGFVNGLLSFITFRNKMTRESGCGIYLLSSSVITLITMIVFLLKFFIVLLSQMRTITNESFLKAQCYSIDFLLRFSLTMDQWLTAFVAIERAFVVTKGVNFNKKKSKTMAKWIIVALILMTVVSNIHDPIYRKLFVENDDDDKKRFWCITEYSSSVRIINLIITILHFILPFMINLISALIIIIISTQQQVKIKKKRKYREILNVQIQKHKNLLIGPCVLIILGIPRFITSFVPGCMKSLSDSWLYLIGYFISLIPPLLTFILFVLPSSTYKRAFRQVITRYRNMIKQDS